VTSCACVESGLDRLRIARADGGEVFVVGKRRSVLADCKMVAAGSCWREINSLPGRGEDQVALLLLGVLVHTGGRIRKADGLIG